MTYFRPEETHSRSEATGFGSRRTTTALIILDGFGLSHRKKANAVIQARTPRLDELMARYPMTTLGTSGEDVGLVEGQMGDSNVGHLNLGAGRIVYQDLVRINKSIADRSFFDNPVFKDVVTKAAGSGAALHLMGLLSNGGVHSHVGHLFALLDLAAGLGVGEIYVHCFLDGRDVPPTSAGQYIEELEAKLKDLGRGAIATVMGRYYAMDRDKRWDRVEKAYNAMVLGQGETAETAAEAVRKACLSHETDEFVYPTVITRPDGSPTGVIKSGDSVIFYNYRADRAREITRSLIFEDFREFPRQKGYFPVNFAGMARYDETFPVPYAFPPKLLTNTLGEVVADRGLTQLRIAETEKYAHVTFFFSGGEEKVFPGEERKLIQSPKVSTYDLKPEMSAYEVTDAVVEAIGGRRFDLIVLNYANCDMVGHTGVMDAAVRAVEAVDECVGRATDALLEAGGRALIVADHGNCDQMVDYETGEPHTNHTLNPAPCILVDESRRGARLRSGGVLSDVAPTILDLMGIPRPPEMDRDSLIADSWKKSLR